MFNLLRKVSICLLLSMAFSNFILGQSYTDRLTARANEEKKILNYVNSNLAKTPSSVITTFKNNITTNEDHPHSYSQIEIDQMVEEAKKSYWRIQCALEWLSNSGERSGIEDQKRCNPVRIKTDECRVYWF